jgi:hypothetical protein
MEVAIALKLLQLISRISTHYLMYFSFYRSFKVPVLPNFLLTQANFIFIYLRRKLSQLLPLHTMFVFQSMVGITYLVLNALKL